MYVLFIAIYLYLFYPRIDALRGEALLNVVVYSMYNDNKVFLFYSFYIGCQLHTNK